MKAKLHLVVRELTPEEVAMFLMKEIKNDLGNRFNLETVVNELKEEEKH